MERRTVTAERKNISQPADWWAAFEAAAEREGLRLSDWVGEACKAKLPKKAAKRLSERIGPGQPRKPKKES